MGKVRERYGSGMGREQVGDGYGTGRGQVRDQPGRDRTGRGARQNSDKVCVLDLVQLEDDICRLY